MRKYRACPLLPVPQKTVHTFLTKRVTYTSYKHFDGPLIELSLSASAPASRRSALTWTKDTEL
jgi:hypothetical protein